LEIEKKIDYYYYLVSSSSARLEDRILIYDNQAVARILAFFILTTAENVPAVSRDVKLYFALIKHLSFKTNLHSWHRQVHRD